MSLTQEVELLKKIPLFANVETSKLKLLAFTSERVAYRAGERVFEQDEVGDAAYIIVEGEADVIVRGPAGPVVLATVAKNDFVGEIAASSAVLDGVVIPDDHVVARHLHELNAHAGLRSVADDVASAEHAGDARHVLEHGIERHAIPVDVGDDAESHGSP